MSDKKVDEGWKQQVQAEKERTGDSAGSAPLPKPEFLEFVSMLATQALVSLGHLPHPATGKAEADLEQAQALIDTIEMLAEKTKGNLTDREDRGLQQVLSELRMAFVQATSAPPQTT